MTMGWNFADVWSAAARRDPDAVACIHGRRATTWGDFAAHASGLASWLLAAGLDRQDRVALMLRNRPEYLEGLFGAMKAAMVPVNTNYRYGPTELTYLWDNADARVVVFDDEFTEVCDRVRSAVPLVVGWVHVGDPASCPAWAVPWSEVGGSGAALDDARVGRCGDDLILQYTGGTTGMPKGVMWRQDDLFRMLEAANGVRLDQVTRIDDFFEVARSRVRVLPAAPLMHGTAAWFAMPALSRGGSVVTLEGRSFSATELLDAIADKAVRSAAVVGDVFVKPMLAALDAWPGRWDLSQVRVVFSSGVMFSRESKERLAAYLPAARIIDNLGSQESGAVALSSSAPGAVGDTGIFRPAPGTRVINGDGHDVVAGSGVRGRLALAGHLPLGYHKDPEKTAATFVSIDGRRHVIPGDWAEVLADGSIRLLGRGSQCINTGGEKVYPEEVEEVLKAHAGVLDAAAVGVPDERFGEAVVAVIVPSATPVGDDVLLADARVDLAGYKLPKRIVRVADLGRGPNGKLDYPALRDLAVSS